MNPRDFCRTAEELLYLPSALESNYRSSISRAYYSSFLLVQTAVLQQVSTQLLKSAHLSRQLGHEWLISVLLSSKIGEITAVGEQLNNLCVWRKRADYDMATKVQKIDAQNALKDAMEIHSAIDSFGLPKVVAYVIQHIRELANTRTVN